MRALPAVSLALIAACSGGGVGGGGGGSGADAAPPGDARPLGDPHTGQYQLGPVEWTGSFHNACAPYPDSIETIEGGMLAGLDNSFAASGDWCDACVAVETAKGKKAILRVVTYGVASGPNDMDVSQAAFDALSMGEYPRTMTWRLVECPTTDPLYYQYQTGANPYWTSLWVRNPRQKIQKLEVKSANHKDWFELRRGTDGTLNDDGGFGNGAFTLRVTGVDGAVEETFPSFTAGALVKGSKNLP
jgi:hypothetical protein